MRNAKLLSTLMAILTVAPFALASEPISPQPQQPPIFHTINIRTSNETKQVSATLDNPCTIAKESIAFSGGMQLKQQVWTYSNGKYRVLLDETTSIQGTDSTGALRYASGSSTSDFVYNPTMVTLLKFKKMNTNDQFHAVFVLDVDPVTTLVTIKLEAACHNGLP